MSLQISNLLVMVISHIPVVYLYKHCVLKADVIFAGVFLASSFCVMHESSYSSNAESSSPLVAWSPRMMCLIVTMVVAGFLVQKSFADICAKTKASFKTLVLEEAATGCTSSQFTWTIYYCVHS